MATVVTQGMLDNAAQQQPAPQVTPDVGALSPDEEALLSNLDQAGGSLETERDQQHPLTADNLGTNVLGDAIASFSDGALQSVFETKDFLVGEPTYDQKSGFRKTVERQTRQLTNNSTVNSITSNIGQFTTGMIGAGKLTKGIQLVGKAKAALEIGKAAAVGATAFDPHQERLSNLIQEFPSLQNPATQYLAADPADGNAEARMKAAAESIGLDLAFSVTLTAGLKLFKALKGGDTKAIAAATKEAEAAHMQIPPEHTQGVASVWDQAVDGPKPRPVIGGLGPLQEQALKDAQGLGEVKPPPSSVVAPDGVAPQVVAPEVAQQVSTTERMAVRYRKVKAPTITDENIDKVLTTKFDNGGGDLTATPLDTTDIVDEKSLMELVDTMTKRTVIPDAKLTSQVSDIAAAYAVKPEDVMSMIVQAGKEGKAVAAKLEAAKQLSHVFARDLSGLATKIKYGMVDDAVAATKELRRKMTLMTTLRQSLRDISGGGGRTIRRMRGEFGVSDNALKAWERADDASLVDALYQANGDLTKVREAATPGFWQRVKSGADHLLVNGPLWWYTTHVWNGVSNLLMLGVRPAETLFGSVFQGRAGVAIAKQSLREYRYTASAIMDSTQAAIDAFLKGDSVLAPHMGAQPTEGLAANGDIVALLKSTPKGPTQYADAYLKLTGAATGLPSRALGMQDELFKNIRYRAVVQAHAAGEADSMGLAGKAAEDYIRTALAGAFDEAGAATNVAAMREAQRATLTQKLLPGTVGHATQNAVNSIPGARMIIPYVRTPINDLRHGWKLTPGLNFLQGEYRAMLSGEHGVEEQARAYGQMAIGSGLMALSWQAAMSGKITGAGPRDPDAAKVLFAQGWRPYSYVMVHDDGSKTYVPLNRLGPISLPIGIAADLADMYQHPDKRGDAEGYFGAATLAVIHNVTDRTFLISASSAMRSLLEPEKSFGRFAGNVAEQAIPFSSLVKNMNSEISDPYMKEARGMVDNALDRMPGYSKNVPIKYSPLGEPMVVANGVWSNSHNDPVSEELARISTETGKSLGGYGANKDGVDLRDVTCEDGENAYAKLMRLSAKPNDTAPSLRDALSKLINTPNYDKLVDGDAGTKGTKLNAIASVVSKYREIAYKTVLATSPTVREALMKKRKDTALKLKQKQLESSADNQQGLAGVLNALGGN